MIPLFKVAMSDKASFMVKGVLESGFIGQGSVNEAFEFKLKERFNNPNLVTVNSGTSALQLALRLIKDKYPNKEYIITTPLTCTATNWAILAAGFKIIWADIDPNTLNISPYSVNSKMNDKIAAVMVVHWGGYPVDLQKIERLKEYFNFDIIEDCAHAFGSTYYDYMIGNSANYCCFSFQAIKHLTTGDGGMLILPNEKQYKKAKLLRWYGIDREDKNKTDFRCENDIPEWGYKMHMNDINASIGLANLEIVDENIRKTRLNAWKLRKELRDVKGIRLLNYDHSHDSSYWIFSILVEDREKFNQKMKEAGIMVSQVHERNDKHTCVQEYRSYLPNLESVVNHLSAIPCGWWVKPKEIDYIIDKVKNYLHD